MSNYPEPICQGCFKECEIAEEVETGEGVELWNYCKECDMETFHEIPKQNSFYHH